MDSLVQTATRRKLKDALAKLPENIMGAYDEILESRINSQNNDDRVLAFHVFGWIAFAKHPLTVLELQHALSVDLDLNMTAFEPDNLYSEDLLGSVCAGLVITNSVDQGKWPRNPIVKFAHYTIQEYFMSQKDKLFPQFQKTIACTCLTSMLFNNFRHHYYVDDYDNIRLYWNNDDNNTTTTTIDNNNTSNDRNYLFLRYSLNHWVYYVSEWQDSMVDKIIAFLDSVCLGKVMKTCHAVRSTLAPTPLHLAVQYNLLHITKELLKRGDDPYQCKTPLLLTASRSGNAEMVKLLLDQDKIDPNTQDPRKEWTPLSYAVRRKSLQILEILLQSDRVDVNCKDSTGHTPLSYAVENRSIQMVEMLLQSDEIDVNCKDSIGYTPLSYAAEIESTQMVEMLLQSDEVGVNCADSTGCTPARGS
ncbi:uncharacterized protein ARMOST_10321 [Armillaria ostoyae]|uniref:GPI inositol-deacylase winged helix domain-containing protein n=1 Tax=Armillaria ostoyae TaxID=47428 RepID=A0A284RDZ1_ARMOS|nr:uncharacterized protein ARMOST_10321 [Armillaria ostoyae]